MNEDAARLEDVDQQRRRLVSGTLSYQFQGDLSRLQLSLYHRIADELAASSFEHVRESQCVETVGEIFGVAADALASVYCFVLPPSVQVWSVEFANFWHHDLHPLQRLRNKKTPELNRQGIEMAVGEYLQQPVRSARFDRLLVDLLLALELYQFGDQMMNRPSIPGLLPPPPLGRIHPAASLLKSQWRSLQFFGAIIVLALIARWLHWLSWSPVVAIVAISGVLFILWFGLKVIAYPHDVKNHDTAVQPIAGLLSQMINTYLELNSDGPISAKRVEEQVKASAAAGVVWPAPLYALLDDINSRAGRF